MEETPTTTEWTPRVPDTHTHHMFSRPVGERGRLGKHGRGNVLHFADFGWSQVRYSYRILRRSGASAADARIALWMTAWSNGSLRERPIMESFDGEVYA